MSSKKSRLLETAMQQDLHPFAARFASASPPPSEEQTELETSKITATQQAVDTVSGVAVNTAKGVAGNTDSGMAGKGGSGEVVKPTSGEAGNTARGAEAGNGGTPKLQPNINLLSKWTLYVKPKTQKAVKRLALEDDVNYYDIVQEALDEYLAKRGVKQ